MFLVLVTRRPKYACRTCQNSIVQMRAPARLVEGGLPTEALVAHVIVAKYADHLRFTAKVTAKPRLCSPGHRARPLDVGGLGRPGGLVPAALA